MEYLTKNAIEKRLRSMQNRFNQYTFDESLLLSQLLLIMIDPKTNKKRSRKRKEDFLYIIEGNYYRELVKEYDHVVIAKGKYGKYFIHTKGLGGRLYHPFEMILSERLNTICKWYTKQQKK